MTEKEILKLFEDKEFVEGFVGQKTIEDAQKFLSSKGIDLTIEAVEMLGKCIAEYEKNGELTDDMLEQIAAGKSFASAVKTGAIWTGLALSFPFRAITTSIGAIFGGSIRGWADGWIAGFCNDDD